MRAEKRRERRARNSKPRRGFYESRRGLSKPRRGFDFPARRGGLSGAAAPSFLRAHGDFPLWRMATSFCGGSGVRARRQKHLRAAAESGARRPGARPPPWRTGGGGTDIWGRREKKSAKAAAERRGLRIFAESGARRPGWARAAADENFCAGRGAPLSMP